MSEELDKSNHSMLAGIIAELKTMRCTAGDSLVRTHSDLLATLRTQNASILKHLESIDEKLDEIAKSAQEHRDRLTKLETGKSDKAAIGAMILSCGVVAWEFIRTFRP